MKKETGETNWQATSAEALSGIRAWREAHPKATLGDIEGAVDERLGRLRRQLLEDLASDSGAADWETDKGPVCPSCGSRLERGGKAKRVLITAYDQAIELERRYGRCPVCQTGLFPPG